MGKMSSRRHASPFASFAVVLGVGLGFILQGTVWGETETKEKLVLNLRQLINMAIAESPDVKESRSEVEAAVSDLDQVKAAYYPQFESTTVVGPIDDAKRPLIRNNKLFDPSPGTSLSNLGLFGRIDFTMTQPLYTFGKLSNRKEAAARGVHATKFGLEERKARIALRVKELYFALILARGGIDAAGDADHFFEDARRRISRLLELDSPNVMQSDLYRVDAFRADSIRSRAEAEKGAKVAYFALKSLIQLPADEEFDVTEDALSLREEDLAEELGTYIHDAFANRPELKQLKAAVEAQQFQVQAAQSDRYPSFFLALEGSFAGAPGREHLDSPYIPDDFNHGEAGVVAGMKWDFDFGISKAKINKAMAEYGKLLHTQASAEMNIPIQVANAYQEVRQWRTAVRAYQEAAKASRKWVVAAIGDFDMGIGTAFDMLNAIEKYGHNRGRYIEALFHYNVALAELKTAAGIKDWEEGEGK